MNHSLILVVCELGLATSGSERTRPTPYHPVGNLATSMQLWPEAMASGALGEIQPMYDAAWYLGNPIRKSWRHHVQARKISPDAALRWVSDGGDKKFQRTSGTGVLDSGDFGGEILLMNGNVNSEISCPFSAFVRVSYFGHACWSPTEVLLWDASHSAFCAVSWG